MQGPAGILDTTRAGLLEGLGDARRPLAPVPVAVRPWPFLDDDPRGWIIVRFPQQERKPLFGQIGAQHFVDGRVE